MRCLKCTAENPDRARFCLECGASFGLRCTACGAELPSKARFCLECGRPVDALSPTPAPDPRTYTPKHLAEKILQSKSALEGERKQVTVLFADVKGSMELAEQLDPEEWHKILDRFFEILTDGVHRFEGTVNQYTGDGIMALFGAPISHEDHAQRACYAALHLREALRSYADELRRTQGLSFSTRIGLNSGEVVVGRIGDDLRMDYTAQGHTVGLAARMEQLAEPGRMYMTEHTARLVEGLFQLGDLGLFTLKGVHDPLRVYELQGVGPLRTRFNVARARGLSRFVGRAADLRTLEDAVEQTAAGNGQVVGVVAEAGTGKSRLCFEFLERCRARGMHVYEGHAIAHGRNIPFLPILEVFRAYFGITLQDDDRGAREKIAGRMVVLDQKFAEALPLLYDFLGVSDPQHPSLRLDPEARQRQLIGVMRQVIQSVSEAQPTVTLIEDLHWLDTASGEFLEHMVDARAGSRNLLLVNFRPEYRAEWMQKSWYGQIPLTPLGPEAIAELLADLLGTDPSIAALIGPIHARTGGNPFFIEEVAQTLIESGHLQGTRGAYRLVTPIDRLEVPATVQAVLSARIDRLAEREKRLLQVASVIGKDFPESLLAAVAELPADELKAALATLRRAEFIHEQALYPVAEYSFKHPLTQEVAYHTQLGDRRIRLHASVARVLQALYPDKLDERAALIAHHLEQAGEAFDAARWYARAAQWAGTHDQNVALRHWQRVRKLLAPIADSQEAMTLALTSHTQILQLFWLFGASEEEAATVFRDGKTLANRLGDVRALANLMAGYAGMRLAHGAGDHLDYAREAVRLADESGDLALRRVVRVPLARSLMFGGHYSEGLTCTEEGMERLAQDPTIGIDVTGFNPYTMLADLRADFLWGMGRLAEAAQWFKNAIQRARDDHDPLMLGVACGDYGGNWSWLGDVQASLMHARQGVELAEKAASVTTLALAYAHLGRACLNAGLYSEAVTSLERSRAIGRESHAAFEVDPFAAAALAEAYAYSSEPDRALRTAEEAVAGALRRAPGMQPFAQLALARVLLRTKGLASRGAIEAALEEMPRLARQKGFKVFDPFVCLERAALARLAHDETSWQRELREAHRLFMEMGAPIRAAEVAKELGS